MIDTIKGNMEIKKGNIIPDSLRISSKIKKKEETYNITSNIDNFKITIRYDSVTDKPIKLFFTGSLTKFYFGDNLRQLDWEEMKIAIKKLSKEVGVNIEDANLTRIDFGMNMTVNFPVHEYISCIHEYPRLKYMKFKESVTFLGPARSFAFYDKLKEIKDKKSHYNIPNHLKNSQILRYEIRFHRNLGVRFKLERQMIVKDLFNKTIQDEIIEQWSKGYQKVNKTPLGIDPLFLLQGYNGTYKYLAYHGLEKVGYNKVINTISDLNFDIKSFASKRSKMKGHVRDLLKEVNNLGLERNLVNELDRKINIVLNSII